MKMKNRRSVVKEKNAIKTGGLIHNRDESDGNLITGQMVAGV
jgi:hypothetical protein